MIPRLRKMSEICLGCHGNGFFKFKVVFRKTPEISKECRATFHLFLLQKLNLVYLIMSRSKDINRNNNLYVVFPKNLFILNNWHITSYKTVSMPTGILARITLITSYFLCQSYFTPFQGIWDYSDKCCHGYH